MLRAFGLKPVEVAEESVELRQVFMFRQVFMQWMTWQWKPWMPKTKLKAQDFSTGPSAAFHPRLHRLQGRIRIFHLLPRLHPPTCARHRLVHLRHVSEYCGWRRSIVASLFPFRSADGCSELLEVVSATMPSRGRFGPGRSRSSFAWHVVRVEIEESQDPRGLAVHLYNFCVSL